jgi:hypothetical protein
VSGWWNGARRRALRAALLALPEPVDCFAESMLGCEARIDFVARDPSRRAVVVLLAEDGGALAAVASAAAQCAWLAPRLADWLQLNPQLGVAPETPPRALVVATRPCERSRLAAEALPDVHLLECPGEVDGRLLLRPVASGARREPRAGDGPTPRLASPFRSGLG